MELALLNFAKYVNQFDQSNPKVIDKINHTYRVVELAREISNKLNLTKEDKDILLKIALLHDIGRFYQINVHNSYSDFIFDHSDYGIIYLFNQGHIKEYNENKNINEIIKIAIFYHNKYNTDIPLLDSYTKMFVDLIRDLDKIDIFYMMSVGLPIKFQKSKILDSYLNDFMNKKLIRRLPQESRVDNVLLLCGYIYDFNYPESLELLKEKEYIDKFFANIEVDANSEELFLKIMEMVYTVLYNNEKKRVRC